MPAWLARGARLAALVLATATAVPAPAIAVRPPERPAEGATAASGVRTAPLPERRVLGASGVPVGPPPRTPRDAEHLARAALLEAAEAPRDEALRFLRAARDDGGWWVQFTETYRGLRVVGGKATARVTAGGEIARFAYRERTEIDLDPVPALAEAAAFGHAAAGLPRDAELTPVRAELVVMPLADAAGTIHRLAYEVEILSLGPEARWIAYVDANDGTLLRRFDALRHAAVSGLTGGTVEAREVGDPLLAEPFPFVSLRLQGGGTDPREAVSDAAGAFSMEPGLLGPDTLEVRLSGPYVEIRNHTHGEEVPVAKFSVDPTDSAPVAALFDDGNTRVQDRDAFYWVVRSHAALTAIDPGFTALDYAMPVLTDLAGRECNAFWTGTGLVFYPAGPNCEATSRSASVVIHEYGHGITDLQYRPFYPSAAMHEGWSDYFSATVLDDPIIGHGFFGRGSYIRRIDGGLRAPEDLNGESHHDGLILAGALWDLRTALGPARADSLWHFARYGLADTYDDYLIDVLLTDDDDGTVYNGTPHFNEIMDAFLSHGIGDTRIQVVHDPLPDTEDTGKPLPLVASFLSLFALEPGSVLAHVEIVTGGSTTQLVLPMSPAGGVREYETIVPAQPADTEVRYWFTASDTTGGTATHPSGGASAPFVARVGPDTEPPAVVHEPLRDLPVDADAVHIVADVSDNLDRGVDSVRVSFRWDDDPDAWATLARGAGDRYAAALPPAPALGSTLRYRIQAADSAIVPNAAYAPADGPRAVTAVRGIGRDFEENDGGLAGDGDWEWGMASPPSAYSGDKVWATDLDGFYADQAVHRLEFGPIDLTAWTAAGLFVRHRYDVEPEWDGGSVYASRDGGLEWELLRPDGDYPYGTVEATGDAAYSGRSEGWESAAFDLTAFLGEPDVRIRFALGADFAVSGPGWMLDDLEVVERQVLSRPLAVWALSGRDGRVPLRWSPPAGIPALGPASPLLGYRVHRAEAPAGEWATLNPEVLLETSFEDTVATNGIPYRYAVTAEYAAGPSAPSDPVEAMAYLPSLAASRDTLDVTMPGDRDTTAQRTVANEGTGFLRVNAWAAGPGQALGEVRARFVPDDVAAAIPESGLVFGPDPARYVTVFDGDPAGEPPAGRPDLLRLEAQSDAGVLYLRITAHAPWGDPRARFTFAVIMETDGDRDTGREEGDFSLWAGFSPFTGIGVPAVILNRAGGPIGFPDFVTLDEGESTAEFGFPLALLDRPEWIAFTVRTHDSEGGVVVDRMPDPPPVPWLDLERAHAIAVPGTPADVAVRIDTGGMESGVYLGRVWLESNDPSEPEAAVPVKLTVSPTTPVRLVAFTAQEAEGSVRLAWRTAGETAHAGFHVYRREGEDGLETRITEALLAGDGRGGYAFEDDRVEDGTVYFYRLADLDRDGRATFHGPVAVRYAGASGLAAAVLRPPRPNPAAGATTVRFGLPAEGRARLIVFDAQGRTVRELADEVFPRGYHERVWDRLDERGRRVAAGFYLVRLEAPGAGASRKLVLLP